MQHVVIFLLATGGESRLSPERRGSYVGGVASRARTPWYGRLSLLASAAAALARKARADFHYGLLVVVCATVPARAQTSSIDDFVVEQMGVSSVPGLAYAVVDTGEIASGEFGEILLGSGRRILPDTPFVIGSISKSFTAVAVVQLARAHTIDLDTSISQHLEAFKDSPGSSITLRQLLSHTSGYSTLQGNDKLVAASRTPGALLRQVQRIAEWAPADEPGTRWVYSNANYYVLGALIEVLSGQDYASYIEENVLEPIGMLHSFVADGEIRGGMAVGHTPWFGMKRPVQEGRTDRLSAPVGGVIATASDVARYLAVMMNGEDDLISAKSKAEMMRPASAASPFYGLGWYIDADSGTVSHTGLTPGIETLAIMLPAKQVGAVVFINAGSGMGFGENANIFHGIRTLALGMQDMSQVGGRWGRRALFALFALLPLLFVVGIAQAWLGRTRLRAKSGLFGAFSLWFPLLMTLALAWISVGLIPRLFGVSMATFWRHSPDLALSLIATAATGVAWAMLRLGVAYSEKRTAHARRS